MATNILSRRQRGGPKSTRTALVLHYHRVVEAQADPNRLCVTPQHFSEQLAFLRSHFDPVPLSQLLPTMARQDGPSRPVAITMDDGYADNLHNAKPLLEHYSVPATVFVTTGSLNSPNGFWWDELETLVLQARQLPNTLLVTIDRKAHRFRTATPFWTYAARLLRRSAPSSAHIYHRLRARLLTLSNAERSKVLAEVRAQVDAAPRLESCRVLSRKELRELVRDGLIEIGAHTVTHPVLSALSAKDQEAEIRQSKNDLEQIVETTITAFAYPYGSPLSYTAATISAVREAGFAIACTTLADHVRPNTDPFQLPRFSVGNWSRQELARQLGKIGW